MFSFFRPSRGTGALIDDRPQEEMEKDYLFDEIVAATNPVHWREKPQSQWRSFPIYDQDGSGSCVAQAVTKTLGILYWLRNKSYVHFSATHLYQQRSNRPAAGMHAVDAWNIARNGVTLEELAPSQMMTDAQMDLMVVEEYKRRVGEIFKIPNYVALPVRDIETVASTIQTTGKGVMVWYWFTGREWTDVPRILDSNLPLRGTSTLRHAVTAVDFTYHKGKKALIIEDSWGPGHGTGGRRIITEDFHNVRNYYAGYPLQFKFEDDIFNPDPKPRHTFTREMRFSPTFSIDPEVRKLQDVLKFEGMFPRNTDSTGYYGAITARAVLQFQKKYQVASLTELEALQGRIAGPKTIQKLNELYGLNSN